MAVPKAAMHKDDLSPTWKNQIGAARQIPTMNPVSVALGVKNFPQEQFGGGILAFHGLHGAPSHGRCFHAA
jgi:hypothetical protein